MAFFLIQDPKMRERFMHMMNTRAAENPRIMALKSLIKATGANLDDMLGAVVIEWEKQRAMSNCRLVRRCPVCGKPPVIKRYSPSYWMAACEESHFAESSGCPMKTQKAAWEAWDLKFPPNVQGMARRAADGKTEDG